MFISSRLMSTLLSSGQYPAAFCFLWLLCVQNVSNVFQFSFFGFICCLFVIFILKKFSSPLVFIFLIDDKLNQREHHQVGHGRT